MSLRALFSRSVFTSGLVYMFESDTQRKLHKVMPPAEEEVLFHSHVFK